MNSKIKRVLCLLLCCALLPCAALAENTLASFYRAGTELLLNTPNVRLQGTAAFTWNGKCFKRVDAEYAIDNDIADCSILLHTPRGTEEDPLPDNENGFTLHKEDNTVYAIEVKRPDDVRTVGTSKEWSIVRNTVQVNGLVQLGAALVDTVGGSLNAVVTEYETGGTGLDISLQAEQVTPLMNAVFNQFAQYVMQHSFGVTLNVSTDDGFVDPANDGLTITERILFTTRNFELSSADLHLEMNANGRLTAFSGTAAIDVYARNGMVNKLGAEWSVTADWYNQVVLERYSDDEYVGDTGEGAEAYWGFNMYLDMQDTFEQKAVTNADEALAYAKQLWQLDFCGSIDLNDMDGWSAAQTEDGWDVEFSCADGRLTAGFAADGTVLYLHNSISGLDKAIVVDLPGFEADEAVDWRGELGLESVIIADRLTPGVIQRYQLLGVEDDEYYAFYNETRRTDEAEFIVQYTEPDAERTHRERVIIQTAPITRVVDFNSTVAPDEGGNG